MRRVKRVSWIDWRRSGWKAFGGRNVSAIGEAGNGTYLSVEPQGKLCKLKAALVLNGRVVRELESEASRSCWTREAIALIDQLGREHALS